jgi:hypothetical protein
MQEVLSDLSRFLPGAAFQETRLLRLLIPTVAQSARHGTGAAANIQNGAAACEHLSNGLTLINLKVIFALMAESAPVDGGDQVK